MAKKKIELFVNANNDKEFHSILKKNKDKLFCVEVYCEFSGPCVVLDKLFTRIKLEWGDNKIILIKALADDITVFERFRDKSEPLYVFIYQNRITKLFRGVDAIKMVDVAKKELDYYSRAKAGEQLQRPTFALDEATPEEEEWAKELIREQDAKNKSYESIRSVQQELRKRRRAELMVPHVQNLNFVLFWPHAKHAHFELYERWNMNNIIMVGREELELDEYKARDILYAGDAPINDASLYALQSKPALAICFRCLDDDVHIVTLVRHILYEYIEPLDPAKPARDQPMQKSAFNHYKSYSLSREQILKNRREARQREKEEALERRARRLSELQRLAREEIEEVLEARRLAKEQDKLHLLRIGDLDNLEKLKAEPDDEEVDIVVPEQLSEEEEDWEDIVDDENEYFPPPGLLIPGLYAPPNDIAKANGLAILFPNLVLERVVPEPEFLPPHVLAMLTIEMRHKAVKALAPYKAAVIHMGIFKATSPDDAVHIAYSAKQYDEVQDKFVDDSIMIAFMLSIKTDLPLLQLMDLAPAHVSRDARAGELESSRLFPVYYSDAFEDFETINME